MSTATRTSRPPRSTGTHGGPAVVRWSVVDTAVGRVLIAAGEHGLCSAAIGVVDGDEERSLAAEWPGTPLVRDDAALATAGHVVQRLAAGDAIDDALAAVHLEMHGTDFQRQVWSALRTIPCGTTVTYTQLAAMIGRPSAVRAVASACAANRLALVIPCHRVVRSSGDLGGYRWGVSTKSSLLALERAAATPSGSTRRVVGSRV